MNKFIGIGIHTKKPETRVTKDGKSITRFTLAFNRIKGDSDFINCVAFGKTAEFIEKYFDKGMKMAVDGRIQTGSYEKDGRKVYTTDIVVENVEFVEKKKSDAEPQKIDDSFMDIPDDFPEELPFE